MDPLLTERTEKEHACKVDLLTIFNAMKKQFMALSDDLCLDHGGNSDAWQHIETAIRKNNSYDEIYSGWLNLRKVIGYANDKLKLNASLGWNRLIKDAENQLVQFRQLDTFQSTWNALERAMDSADDPQAIQGQLVRFEKELNRTGIHPKSKKFLSHGQPHLFDPKNKTVQMVVQRSGQLRKQIEKHGKTAQGIASIIDQWVALHHCGQLINDRFKQLSETVHDLLLEHKNNPSKHELSDLEHEWRQLVRTIRSHKSYDEVAFALKQFSGVVESEKYRDYREVQNLLPSIDAFRKALTGKDKNRLPKIWFARESRLQQSFEPVEILRSQWEHIPNGTKIPAHVQGAYQNLLAKLRAGTQAILPKVVQSAVDNMQQSLKDVQKYSPDIEQKDLDAIMTTLTNLHESNQVEMAITLREKQKTRMSDSQTPLDIRLESAFRGLRTGLGQKIGWSKTAALMLWRDIEKAVACGNINDVCTRLKSLNDLLQVQNDPIFEALKNHVAELYERSGGDKISYNPDFGIWIDANNAKNRENINNKYKLKGEFLQSCRISFGNPYEAICDDLYDLFIEKRTERQTIDILYNLEEALENRDHKSFRHYLNKLGKNSNQSEFSNLRPHIATLRSDSSKRKSWIKSHANFHESGQTSFKARDTEASIIGAYQLLVDKWASLLGRLRSDGRLEELSMQTRAKWTHFENKLHHSDDLGAIYSSLEDFANQFEENWPHLGIDPGSEGDLHTQAHALLRLFSKDSAAFNHWQAQLKMATPENFLEFYAKIKNKEGKKTKTGPDTELAANTELALEQAVKSRGWKYGREINIAAIGWEGAGLLCMAPEKGGVDYPDNLPDMAASIDGLASVSFFYGVSAIIQGKGLWDTRQARKKGKALAEAAQEWLEKLGKNTKDPAVVLNRAIAEEALALGKTLQEANNLSWPQKAKIISDIIRRLGAAVTFTLLTLIAAGVAIELPHLAPLAIIAGVNFIGAGIAAWNQHDMKKQYQAKAEYMAFLKDNLLPLIDELEASNLDLDEGVRNLIAKAKTDKNLLATMNAALTLFTTGMLAWGTKAALNMAGTEAANYVAQIFGHIANSEAALYAIVTATKLAYDKYQAHQKNKDFKQAQTQFTEMMGRENSVDDRNKFELRVKRFTKKQIVETSEQLKDHIATLPLNLKSSLSNVIINKDIDQIKRRVHAQKFSPKWKAQSSWKITDLHREALNLKSQTIRLRTAVGDAFLEEIENLPESIGNPTNLDAKKLQLRHLLNEKIGKTPQDLDWSISAKIMETSKPIVSQLITHTQQYLENSTFSDNKNREGQQELSRAGQVLQKGDVFEAAKHLNKAFGVISPDGYRLAPFTKYRKNNARLLNPMKNLTDKIVVRLTQSIELNVFETELHQLSQANGPEQILSSRITDTLLAKDPAALPASFLWMLQNQNTALSTGANRILRMMGVDERGINNLRQIPISAMAVNKMARVMAAPPRNGGSVQTTEISTPPELRRELWPDIKKAALAPQSTEHAKRSTKPYLTQTQQRNNGVSHGKHVGSSTSQLKNMRRQTKPQTTNAQRSHKKAPSHRKRHSSIYNKTSNVQVRDSVLRNLDSYGNDVVRNMRPDALFGLPNFYPNGVDNACYLNASLQILYALPQMKNLLNSESNDLDKLLQSKENRGDKIKVVFAKEIQTLLRAIYHEATAKKPNKALIAQLQEQLFFDVIRFKPENGLAANRQNSAHEFLTILLEALNAEKYSNLFIRQKSSAHTDSISKRKQPYLILERDHFPSCYQINSALGNTVQEAFDAERLPRFNRNIEHDIEIKDAISHGLKYKRIWKQKDRKWMARIEADKTTSFTGTPPRNFIVSVDRDVFGQSAKNTKALETGEISFKIDHKTILIYPLRLLSIVAMISTAGTMLYLKVGKHIFQTT